jgi:hypothetical protein
MELETTSERYVMHKFCIMLAGAGIIFASSPVLAQTASSSAYALGVNETVSVPLVPNVNVSVGPLVPVSGSAAPNYNVSGQLLSLTQAATLVGTPLVGINEGIGTGLLLTNANGSASAAEATATVNNLSLGLNSNLLFIPVSLLNLSATTIESYSQANSIGGLDASGHTTIEGLSLGGTALGNLVFDGSLFINPDPNTVLLSLAGLSIILNEQIASGDGSTFSGISTNAIAIRFNNFALGTGLANGAVIIGHTEAAAWAGRVAGIPEPATWAMMLMGFGAIGYAIRRRRRLQPKYA